MRVVHKNVFPYDVYIGRGSKWGNPYSHMSGTKAEHRVKTRREAIEKYEAWIQTQPHLMESLHELEGKVLGCYCKPYPCHGDVLIRLLDEKSKGAGKTTMGLRRRQAEIAKKRKAPTRKKNVPTAPVTTANTRRSKGIAQQRNTTEALLTQESKDIIAKAETTEEVQAVLDEELPMGYTAIGRNDYAKLMHLKEKIIESKLASFDYETNGDPDDDTQDAQDHEIVGVSFAYEIGQAFYMPIAHVSYGANWDIEWFVEHFLKPILEHPEVAVIAHNI